MNIFKKAYKRLWCLHTSCKFVEPVYKSKEENIWVKVLVGYNYECNECEKIIFKEKIN